MSSLICEASENAPPACLFAENSHRLVSLRDIVQDFMAWQFAAALRQIQDFECMSSMRCVLKDGEKQVTPERLERLRSFLPYWRRQCEAIELRSAIERIEGPIRVALKTGLTNNTLNFEMRALRETIASELNFSRFAYVPASKATVLDKMAHDWENVWERFADSEIDTRAAIECYALDQNTACVFHLVRLSEHGLRGLARKLRVTLKHKGKKQAIEFAEWDKVITGVTNKITTARALHHGAKRAAQLAFYSNAADHCLYMKELRNEVSHTRKDLIQAKPWEHFSAYTGL